MTRNKYCILLIIFIFICSSLTLTNLLYLKIYPFEFIKSFINTSPILISSTLTSTTTTVRDVNEILCNNISNYNHLNISDNPCEKTRCAVILRESGGRLGNRMFMFASAYGLARRHNCRLHVSRDIIQELSFNFQMPPIEGNMWLSREDVANMNDIIIKDTICNFLPELFQPNVFKYIELHGYWQSYLYFDVYKEGIREYFSGRVETLNTLSKYFYDISQHDCQLCSILRYESHNELCQAIQIRYNITWIGIHIRRGDFHSIGYASDENYIHHAIEYYKQRYYSHKLRFLVASDDKTYCEKLFENEIKSEEIIILPVYFSQSDDLIALSLCQHSIVTGGTYGFWAGYLAGGEVIHDVMYPVECSRIEYYPSWFL